MNPLSEFRWWMWAGLGGLGFLVFLTLSVTGALRFPVDSGVRSSDRQIYVPAYARHDGRELVMVYIGSSRCGFSNLEALPAAVERAKLLLQQKSKLRGLGFSTVGVSLDWHVADGINHLEKYGLFDEVATGKSWWGLGARQHFGGALTGVASTPQVLAYVRSIQGGTGADHYYRESGHQLLVRKMGVDPIIQWVQRGAPIPADTLKSHGAAEPNGP